MISGQFCINYYVMVKVPFFCKTFSNSCLNLFEGLACKTDLELCLFSFLWEKAYVADVYFAFRSFVFLLCAGKFILQIHISYFAYLYFISAWESLCRRFFWLRSVYQGRQQRKRALINNFSFWQFSPQFSKTSQIIWNCWGIGELVHHHHHDRDRHHINHIRWPK